MVYTTKNRGVRRKTEQPTGCKRRIDRGKSIASPGNARHAFLKNRFNPVVDKNECNIPRSSEQGILTSLANIMCLYKGTMPDISKMPFPLNISILLSVAQKHLKAVSPELEIMIVQEEDSYRVATIKAAGTENTLLYIPLKPLLKLSGDKSKKKTKDLLFSMFAYLHNIVEIPMCGEYSYIGNLYSMILEMHENEEDENWSDPEVYFELLSTLREATYYSDKWSKKMNNENLLNRFEERFNSFQPKDEVEQQTYLIAGELLSIFKKYPFHSLMGGIIPGLVLPEEESRIFMEQLISFVWSYDDWLFSQLEEYVNCELNEMCVCDEPLSLQYFDTPQSSERHDLDFEENIYRIVIDLINHLIDINEKY